MPSPLDHIGRSPFAFRPPIKNADPNEWMLAVIASSEVKIVNARTGRGIWMPRRYIDSVSCAGGLLTVGITKELEYRGGTLRPRLKGVIEMPLAPDDARAVHLVSTRSSGPAPVIGIRVEDSGDSHTNRALIFTGIGAIVISILAALSGLARL